MGKLTTTNLADESLDLDERRGKKERKKKKKKKKNCEHSTAIQIGSSYDFNKRERKEKQGGRGCGIRVEAECI